MTYAERKADDKIWENFAEKLGVTIDDIKLKSRECLVSDGSDKASIPAWLRDRILNSTEWLTNLNVTKLGTGTDG